MSKLVIFRIEQGAFDRGFPIKVEIRENGRLCGSGEVRGELAPAPEIPELYKEWQQNYYAWGERFRWWGGNLEDSSSPNHTTRQIVVPPKIDTNSSSDNNDDESPADKLETAFNHWLERSSLRAIEYELLKTVRCDEAVRFIIQTDKDNLELQKLPWELWYLLREHYNHPEVALSSRRVPEKGALSIPVKILAILGGDENIDIKTDWNILKNSLPGSELELLNKPSCDDLREKLSTQSWDIVFFAGHSLTKEDGTDGRIWINDRDYLSPGQLRISLEKAVKHGLKLAIFNSCDGMGLARQLEELHIPHIIVMREPIHDRVAQKFLENFLTQFAQGASLHEAVREARDRLRLIEHRSPKASLLPVIFQNPEESPLYYPQLEETPESLAKIRSQTNRRTRLIKLITAIALALLGLVIAIAIHRFFIAPDAKKFSLRILPMKKNWAGKPLLKEIMRMPSAFLKPLSISNLTTPKQEFIITMPGRLIRAKNRSK
jgi:branched-chain amino acid transport system substrate-binding protein